MTCSAIAGAHSCDVHRTFGITSTRARGVCSTKTVASKSYLKSAQPLILELSGVEDNRGEVMSPTPDCRVRLCNNIAHNAHLEMLSPQIWY
jgi:hypothetical protein